MPLGVELGDFSPARRDPRLRRKLGIGDDQPLLIYAGRIDGEKRAQLLVDAFALLPRELGAQLVLIGDGPLRDSIRELGDPRIHAPGYVRDRSELARWLASADIYVSGMADETFGVSIVEAQASGLPVVGVAAGAMVDRVTPEIGRLGPVDDAAGDGTQHPRGLELGPCRHRRGRPAPCPPVQLGPQHVGPVHQPLSQGLPPRLGPLVAALGGNPSRRWPTPDI